MFNTHPKILFIDGLMLKMQICGTPKTVKISIKYFTTENTILEICIHCNFQRKCPTIIFNNFGIICPQKVSSGLGRRC